MNTRQGVSAEIVGLLECNGNCGNPGFRHANAAFVLFNYGRQPLRPETEELRRFSDGQDAAALVDRLHEMDLRFGFLYSRFKNRLGREPIRVEMETLISAWDGPTNRISELITAMGKFPIAESDETGFDLVY